MGWVMVLMPLTMLVLGFPIFLILLSTALTILMFFMSVPLTAVHQIMFDSLNRFALLAVPFFIFAGDLMTRGGLSERLLRWVSSMIGSVRGSLPLTSLGFAAVFGAISGATTASVAAVGSLTYPRMRQAGYSQRFAAALITAEGAIDNLIPPSIGMIIYGIAADTSIIALFAAGIVPGLLLAGLFGIYIYFYAARLGLRETEQFSLSEFLAASKDGVWALGAIIVILGGIYSGVFSPTEAAGVACVYAIFVTLFIYRGTSLAEIFEISARTVYLTALIFTIVAVASLYAWLLTISGVAATVAGTIAALDMPPWAVLLMINLLLLFVGCFLDTPTALLVLTPLLTPIARSIGVDPIHFGVIVVMNLTIGTFTPPFGLNIFVCQALFKVPSRVLFPGLLPFIVLAVFALMLVTFIPALSLWILKYLL